MILRRARSAVTGRFVSLLYAAKHKATTIVETVTDSRGNKWTVRRKR